MFRSTADCTAKQIVGIGAEKAPDSANREMQKSGHQFVCMGN
jgi:hypothetical protein